MNENDISSDKYLGDIKVVSRLLKGYAEKILTYNGSDRKEFNTLVETEARKLAKVFLGQNKKFPGPAWFSPGQIDVAVAKREGVDSKDPEERVAGGLVGMAIKLLKLVEENPTDWQGSVDKILKYYTYLMAGLPLYLV